MNGKILLSSDLSNELQTSIPFPGSVEERALFWKKNSRDLITPRVLPPAPPLPHAAV